jgi:hypothetical protein
VFFATVARLVFFASVTLRCFLRRFLGVFCDGPGCLLHWQPVFFATVVFSALVSGVFCHGNRGILRQLEVGRNANTRLVLVYYAYDNLDLYDTRHEREYEY